MKAHYEYKMETYGVKFTVGSRTALTPQDAEDIMEDLNTMGRKWLEKLVRDDMAV